MGSKMESENFNQRKGKIRIERNGKEGKKGPKMSTQTIANDGGKGTSERISRTQKDQNRPLPPYKSTKAVTDISSNAKGVRKSSSSVTRNEHIIPSSTTSVRNSASLNG